MTRSAVKDMVSAREQRSIEVATRYAVANGYSPSDQRAIGLVLAGMVIGATLDRSTAAGIAKVYAKQFPIAPTAEWARYIAGADHD